jgi:hypothetical protein
VAQLFLEARELVVRGIICEMRNVDGVPPGVMLSVASLVRPYCLFVVAHVDDRPMAAATVRHLKTSGIHAMSAERPPGLSETAALHWMKCTIEASRRVFKSTVLHRVGSRRFAELAARLGATHASFDAGG